MSEYSHLRIPLLTLLSHPRCRQSLRAFALQEHSEETICFIEDVEGLRELCTAWQAEKERTQQSAPQQQQAGPRSSFAGSGCGAEFKRPSDLEAAAEEEELLYALPASSIPPSPAQSATRSISSVSLQSPLHRHSLLSGASQRRDSDTSQLRDFTFPVLASSSPAAAGLRLDASRSSILNARGEAVNAVSLVTEAAMKIWSKYQPGSQWAVSWHPEQLRAVQAAIRAGGGRLDSPLLFNGQEELEIENVQAGTLSRFYGTNDYRRLCDLLLAELAHGVQALTAAQPSRFAAHSGDSKPAASASAASALQSASLLSAIAETKERRDSRQAAEGRLNGTVNLSTILRMDTAISVSGTPTRCSPPASPPAEECDSPASPASPALASRQPLRLRKGRSLLSLHLQQDGDEVDSEDERKTATPPIRQSSSLHILLPRRSPKTAATAAAADDSRPRPVVPQLQAIRRLSEFGSPSPSVGSSNRQRGSSAAVSPASPSACSSPAGELEMLCQHGFFLFHYSPLGSQLLRSYMASEWSLDNYDCLLAMDAYSSRAMSDGSRRREAKAVFHSFLSVHSKHEVTFPSELRQELTRALSSPQPLPCSLFDAVFDVVLQTVRIDVFRRFVRSAAYHRLSARMRDSLSPPAARTGCSLPAVSRVSQAALSTPPLLAFSDVLADAELLAAYTAFCQREHSEEHALFYQAALRYQQLDRSDAEQVNSTVQQIHSRYVEEGADYEVHLPLQLKTELRREMAYPHPELYDKAMAFVVAVMREDSGKRFMSSLECRNAVRKRSI